MIRRILLVDDDDLLRTGLALTLTRAGYEVVGAADGREALKLWQGTGFDLLIIDMVMPEKDGVETLLEFRKLNPPPKVIAISGGGRMEAKLYLEMARFLGALRMLPKPFRTVRLLDEIGDILSGGGGRSFPDDEGGESLVQFVGPESKTTNA